MDDQERKFKTTTLALMTNFPSNKVEAANMGDDELQQTFKKVAVASAQETAAIAAFALAFIGIVADAIINTPTAPTWWTGASFLTGLAGIPLGVLGGYKIRNVKQDIDTRVTAIALKYING